MILFERTIQENFWLFIPLIVSIFVLAKVSRTAPQAIKTMMLSHTSKTRFKHFENTKVDQNILHFYLLSLFIHCIYIYSFPEDLFIAKTTLCFIAPCLFYSKKIIIIFSGRLFEERTLFNSYQNSHNITVIIQGLFLLPFSIINIIYEKEALIINKMVISLFLSMLVYRTIYYFFSGRALNISYFHLFSYLCTLEILPLVCFMVYIL